MTTVLHVVLQKGAVLLWWRCNKQGDKNDREWACREESRHTLPIVRSWLRSRLKRYLRSVRPPDFFSGKRTTIIGCMSICMASFRRRPGSIYFLASGLWRGQDQPIDPQGSQICQSRDIREEDKASTMSSQKTAVDDDVMDTDSLPLGLGFRFDTKYNEQTGLLHAFNLGLERFRPGKGVYDFATETYDNFYTRPDAIPKPDDESGWEGQQSGTVDFVDDGADGCVDVESLPAGTMIHLLFHFHDNYCDATLGFLDRDKAERTFHEMQNKMWDKIEEYRNVNGNGWDFCVVKQDQWHCDLLECELTGRPYSRYINQTGGWTRPDKGDTWWLRSLVLE